MKNLSFLIVLCLSAFQGFGQVGIGTTNPQATLDVNGSIRVTGISSEGSVIEAVRIVGVDENGSFIEIEVGENIVLEENELRAVDRKSGFGDIPIITTTTINDLGLIILPGEPNDDKRVIRIITSVGDIDITGIEAAEDGQTIWLLAYSGRVRLQANDGGSLPANQIRHQGAVILQQYDMVQLIYDATLQRWLVMEQ